MALTMARVPRLGVDRVARRGGRRAKQIMSHGGVKEADVLRVCSRPMQDEPAQGARGPRVRHSRLWGRSRSRRGQVAAGARPCLSRRRPEGRAPAGNGYSRRQRPRPRPAALCRRWPPCSAGCPGQSAERSGRRRPATRDKPVMVVSRMASTRGLFDTAAGQVAVEDVATGSVEVEPVCRQRLGRITAGRDDQTQEIRREPSASATADRVTSES